MDSHDKTGLHIKGYYTMYSHDQELRSDLRKLSSLSCTLGRLADPNYVHVSPDKRKRGHRLHKHAKGRKLYTPRANRRTVEQEPKRVDPYTGSLSKKQVESYLEYRSACWSVIHASKPANVTTRSKAVRASVNRQRDEQIEQAMEALIALHGVAVIRKKYKKAIEMLIERQWEDARKEIVRIDNEINKG